MGRLLRLRFISFASERGLKLNNLFRPNWLIEAFFPCHFESDRGDWLSPKVADRPTPQLKSIMRPKSCSETEFRALNVCHEAIIDPPSLDGQGLVVQA